MLWPLMGRPPVDRFTFRRPVLCYEDRVGGNSLENEGILQVACHLDALALYFGWHK